MLYETDGNVDRYIESAWLRHCFTWVEWLCVFFNEPGFLINKFLFSLSLSFSLGSRMVHICPYCGLTSSLYPPRGIFSPCWCPSLHVNDCKTRCPPTTSFFPVKVSTRLLFTACLMHNLMDLLTDCELDLLWKQSIFNDFFRSRRLVTGDAIKSLGIFN